MIIIVGGGMVGLVLAAALSQQKVPVTVVESQLPIQDNQTTAFNARVSAINAVSHRLLECLGIWPHLPEKSVTPLRGLHAWDYSQGGEVDFDSADIGEAQLGFIVDNQVLTQTLWQHLQAADNVTLLCPKTPTQIVHGDTRMKLQLDEHTQLSAQLIIGADGSQSWVRAQMGVPVTERPYDQQALVAVLKTEKPHQQMGWQSFLPTGPLGLLPLADDHTVAMVWSNDLAAAERLCAVDKETFNRELSAALNHRLGELQCLTQPVAIPLIMRHVDQYVQPRLALVGDAAHTIHPLAGQGVNLGFMDAACLAQVLVDAQNKQQDIGSLRVLRRYQRWRKGDNALMLAAMRGFKDLFGSKKPGLMQLRSQGLNQVNQLGCVKNAFMRYAMGWQGELPQQILF